MKTFHKKLDITVAILGSLCFLYFLYLSLVYGFFSISFSWTFLVMGICLLALSYYELHNKQHILYLFPRYIQRVIISFFVVGILFFVSMEGYIIYQGQQHAVPTNSTAIVLGAQLQGKDISRLLRYRLDTAIEFAKQYPSATIIVSGGKGKGESVSEASAMKDYLLEHGVDKQRIIMEDTSRNTLENIKYSSKKLSQSQSITIITNSFHMARAQLIASRTLPTTSSYSYSAKTDWDLIPVFYFREFFGFCKDLLLT